MLRNYISKARNIDPVLNKNLKDRIVNAYISARNNPMVTPRYLLSLIRISMAHARLRLSNEVENEDVEVAIYLLETMKVPTASKKEPLSLKHSIYNFIISLAKNKDERKVVNLEELFSTSNFSRDALEDVISDFAA